MAEVIKQIEMIENSWLENSLEFIAYCDKLQVVQSALILCLINYAEWNPKIRNSPIETNFQRPWPVSEEDQKSKICRGGTALKIFNYLNFKQFMFYMNI